MVWYIGTSGWSYAKWDRKFYPANLKAEEKLAHYSKYFSSVEVNASFYHHLGADTYRQWRAKVPSGFSFSVKLHRYLTQMKKLKIDDKARAERDWFFEEIQGLHDQLGVILIQLPPAFKRNLERLNNFLEAMPGGYPYAIEFRNDSWFDEEVAEVLDHKRVGVVVSHAPKWPYWLKATGNFVYARFHGKTELFRSAYDADTIKAWADAIMLLKKVEQPGWIFFNNTVQGHAVHNAQQLARLLAG